MGSGKSTVARIVAERTGRRCIDLDAHIVSRTGMSIARWYQERGEAAFRIAEAQALAEAINVSEPLVIALGGGAVLHDDSRRLLLSKGLLLTLTAPVQELARRIEGSRDRPLLVGKDVAATLQGLMDARASSYAECHAVIHTHGRDPGDIATEIAQLSALRSVVVPLGERSYSIWIGRGLDDVAGRAIEEMVSVQHIVLVSDSNIRPLAIPSVIAELEARGKHVIEVTLAPGESHKTLSSVEAIWDAAIAGNVTRGDLVLAVGGGVVGDLAGFAAATLLRGMQLGHLPTTLLSMVDSSVGGKTGFDRPQGKNLIGAFYQPRFVVCDLQRLETLPDVEYRSGLAEVVKAAWISGTSAVEFLERHTQQLLNRHEDTLAQAVEMAVALKAQIVTADEQESGRRRVLNLGHTIGHAIEALENFEGMRHGEAVALGMMAAAKVGRHIGITADNDASRLRQLLHALGLPIDVGPWLTRRELFPLLGADKKRLGNVLHYVVFGEPGHVHAIPLTLEDLRNALGAKPCISS
ncbi:MAG: 3-dehydroquinate synthase [Myxococcales bacterium]|nr:3-dehydroquinate synthase [Myxococcales bacterium]